MFPRQILILSIVFLAVSDGHLRHPREFGTPHRFERAQCWAQMSQMTSIMHQAVCRPRETMVDVIIEASNIMIFPNKVAVKRCDGGSCYGQSSCLPVDVREIPFAVRKHDFRTNREYCGVIYVEEHTSCKCGCSVMAHHCTQKQRYVLNGCRCECMNSHEKGLCLDEGKVWDPNNCACMCREMYPECSTGTEWVPSMCKCMRIMMDDTNEVFYS